MAPRWVKEVASKNLRMAGETAPPPPPCWPTPSCARGSRTSRGRQPHGAQARDRKAVDAVVEDLKRMSKSTKGQEGDRPGPPPIASNNDKTIGSLIAEAMEKVARTAVSPSRSRSRRTNGAGT